ncbi:MAG: hypothetical protein AB7L84_03880 [Acidimicrobiia bacterium]
MLVLVSTVVGASGLAGVEPAAAEKGNGGKATCSVKKHWYVSCAMRFASHCSAHSGKVEWGDEGNTLYCTV